MQNSRMALRAARAEEERPHNSSKGKGIILEQPYKPGFVDDKDLETVKMAIDKELGEIANAFYETTERTADTITRIEKLEIGDEDEGLLAKIEEVSRVSIAGDAALAERITTVSAESSAGLAKVTNEITAVSDKLGTVEAKWGLSVEAGDVVGSIQLGATSGGESEFRVRADKFVVSNGTGGKNIPFEIVGNNTRIKSAYVNYIQSDNWDGAGTGWAIANDGTARFNNVVVKGVIQADSGYFNNASMENITGKNINVTTGKFDDVTVSGTINAVNGTFDNVTINKTCVYKGDITSDQVQDTAVTALERSSNNLTDSNLAAKNVNHVWISGNITTARPYDRILFLDHSGGTYSYLRDYVQGTALAFNKRVIYNGNEISNTQAVVVSGGVQSANSFSLSSTCKIPANTSGPFEARLTYVGAPGTGEDIIVLNSPPTPCLISIFKVSNELS